MHLPRPYLTAMAALLDAGGAGTIDQMGRVVAGPTGTVMPGDSIAWLRLVAAGLVAGEDGKIIVTTLGRDYAAKHRTGVTRAA